MSAKGNIRKPELKVIAGSATPVKVKLLKSAYTIGAADSCDIVASGAKVSDIHASIELDPPSGDWLLRNKSHFGSLLNRERVDVAIINPGDQIQVGESVLLRFQGKRADAAVEKTPEQQKAAGGKSGKKYLIGAALAFYGVLLLGAMVFLSQERARNDDSGLSAEYLQEVMAATRQHLQELTVAPDNPGPEQLSELYFRVGAASDPAVRESSIRELMEQLDDTMFQAWLAEQRGDKRAAMRLYRSVEDMVPDMRAPVAQVARWRMDQLQGNR